MLTLQRLDLNEAHVLLEGARTKANTMGLAMCIAVVDESGNLIAFDRMDGSKITSITIAQDKAFTAAAAKKATHEYNAANVPGNLVFGIHTEVGGRISSVGGGLPIEIEGEVVGGIGVSAGSPQQDMEVAQAGIDHFLVHRLRADA